MTTIGIDLGTRNSAAAYVSDDGQQWMITSDYGPTRQGMTFPSYVQYDARGNPIIFGERARLSADVSPKLVVWGAKRLIGRPYDELQATNELRRFAFDVRRGLDGSAEIEIAGRRVKPTEIAERLLQWIRDCAESDFNPFIHDPADGAVVTLPAYFDPSQRDHTMTAASGVFKRVTLISEPEAAAMAYAIDLKSDRSKFVLVVDWGAGTLDVVLVALRQSQEDRPTQEPIRPARGNVALGGMDMDDLLMASAIDTYKLDDYRDIRLSAAPTRETDRGVWQGITALRQRLEEMKIDLSVQAVTRGDIVYRGKPVTLKMARTRRDRSDKSTDWILLEPTLQGPLGQFRRQIEFTLEESGIPPDELHDVLLIGGPTAMPCVRQVVASLFRKNRNIINRLEQLSHSEGDRQSLNPMEAVARGAALLGAEKIARPKSNLIARDFGVLLGVQGAVLINDGDVLPCEESLQHPLSNTGQTEVGMQVGLFKREHQPEGKIFTRMGDYQFTLTYRNGRSSFRPTLVADREGMIGIKIDDLHSGNTLTLERLNSLDGNSIAEPIPFSEESDTAGWGIGHGDATQDRRISAEAVDMMRHGSQAVLNVAESKHSQLAAAPDDGRTKPLKERMQKLKSAIEQLPAGGETSQEVYQRAQFCQEELINFLDTNRLLEPHDRQLLDR